MHDVRARIVPLRQKRAIIASVPPGLMTCTVTPGLRASNSRFMASA